ncbi:MAG: hypothetical protein Q9220_000558 [cf. Caloplaca sp. 1 TL-2023]
MFTVAINVPLPNSPGYAPKEWESESSTSPAASSIVNFVPSVAQLLSAETFVEEVLRSFEKGKFFGKREIPHTSIRIIYPKVKVLTPSYISTFSAHLFRKNQRPGILVPLLIHLFQSRSYSNHLLPEILNTAVDHPQFQTISADALNVVISFRILRLPHSNPRSFYLYNSILAMGVCLLFIMAIELAIAWNHVGGLNNMGAVGQLVPAVLGVGGIIKVAWAFWNERKMDKQMESAVPYRLRKCAELYETLKEAKERPHSCSNPRGDASSRQEV